MHDRDLAQELLLSAAQCRRMAEDATTREARETFIRMAEQYEDALANLLGNPSGPVTIMEG